MYNAINGTAYDNPDDLEITTLEDVIFMSMKNQSEVSHMLLTEFDEKKFAKTMWNEGHESGYMVCQDDIFDIMEQINKGNNTLEKLTALGYDAGLVKKY